LPLELRIDFTRQGKSSFGSPGRILKEGDGERVDGKLGLVGGEAEGQPGRVSHREKLVELGGKGIKVGCKDGSGVAGSVTRRVTDPRSLTLVVTARGTILFASLRTRAARSGKVAAIRDACKCSEGEEQGAKNLLSAMGSDFGAWVTGTLLLADATLAAVMELLKKEIGGFFFVSFFSFLFFIICLLISR